MDDRIILLNPEQMIRTNETAIDELIEDLRNTPHAVGLALLRERLLQISDITKESIKNNREDWVNPIFSPELFLDLCRRIDKYLAFDIRQEEL